MVNATPWPLYTRERPGTHCVGDWVGPRAGLVSFGKYLALTWIPYAVGTGLFPGVKQLGHGVNYPPHLAHS